MPRPAITNYSGIVERSASVGAVLRAHNETRINAFAHADTREARMYVHAKMRGGRRGVTVDTVNVERNIRLITNLITPGSLPVIAGPRRLNESTLRAASLFLSTQASA